MADSGYFLGIDIGTNSIGYAATDSEYTLKKLHGEPVWGVHLFDSALTCSERRTFRTARRRLERRKQRIRLLRELMAEEIYKKDPDFFIRQDKSALYAEDCGERYSLFNDPSYTDKQYHEQYPTIHHLICDLMENTAEHDVRLVYLACAWLIAHRGHFLSDISMDNIEAASDFSEVYSGLTDMLVRRAGGNVSLPWTLSEANLLGNILKQQTGITKKKREASQLLFGGKAPKYSEEYLLNIDSMLGLMCGGKVSAEELFDNEDYDDIESFSLDSDDEKLAEIIGRLGEDGEVIRRLKEVFDWSQLAASLEGASSVSDAKVKIYKQHRKDLALLKRVIRKYAPDQYDSVFRSTDKENYVSYSYHTDNPDVKKIPAEKFCKFIGKILKDITPDAEDAALFEDMLSRVDAKTFMPKQKKPENRVIPHQLYLYELKKILENAAHYLPFLSEKDDDGQSVADKIISVFSFRVPYYVGPLNAGSPYAWLKRKAEGKIYPWNFSRLVDEDQSEQEFIRRMVNRCTYIPSADVLPKESLLYHRYTVLNEINNIKIDGQPISVEQKQEIYNKLFMCRRRVTYKALVDFLLSRNIMTAGQKLEGIDEQIKSDLKPYHDFARLLSSGILNEEQAEEIILRLTCTDEKQRFVRWLRQRHPELCDEDVKYISGLKYKDFGRLSREFLGGIAGTGKDSATGEAFTVISAMWNTNENLMRLMSGRYTFADTVNKLRREYYDANPATLDERLDKMYVPTSVRRPIKRALEIAKEVAKAMGAAPARIFVEMPRGNTRDDSKAKRTKTRREQIAELYSGCDSQEVRLLQEQLEALGEAADTRLRGDKLFLYFMQFGRCAYSGQAIDIGELAGKAYDIEHIYPRSLVKDDSIHNNKVLVLSELNGLKSDTYPVPADIRSKMAPVWEHWHKTGTISDEKYKRLTRSTGFTEEEKRDFINRQLVETSQASKAVAELLKERYPETDIVYVKSSQTSDFRKGFGLIKSRTFNDLHHAKDAYICIVAGNAYYMRFTRFGFDTNQKYSLNTDAIFGSDPRSIRGIKYWDGTRTIEKVKNTLSKNNAHCTKYAFCRNGGFFDQLPYPKAAGLIPRKANLPPEKYGGYNKPSISFFVLVKYACGNKSSAMILPVELLHRDEMLRGTADAERYAQRRIEAITGKKARDIGFPLGLRPIKINTVLSFDGFRFTLSGVSNGGKCLIAAPFMMFSASRSTEAYIKHLEKLSEAKAENPDHVYSEQYDKVTAAQNLELYELYCRKLKDSIYSKRLNPPVKIFEDGREKFANADIYAQTAALLNMHSVFGRVSNGCDLTIIGGTARAAATMGLSSTIDNWKKSYSDVRIIDASASGLWEKRSENLLELI